MSVSRSFVHARVEKHIRRANTGGKFRLGGTSAVYEDPHGLSLRWLHLRDVLNEDTDSTAQLTVTARLPSKRHIQLRQGKLLSLWVAEGHGTSPSWPLRYTIR